TKIDRWQVTRSTVAAADAPDAVDVFVGKSFVQISEPFGIGSGEKSVQFPRRTTEFNFQPEFSHIRDRGVDALRFNAARRRNKRDCVAGLKSFRFYHSFGGGT